MYNEAGRSGAMKGEMMLGTWQSQAIKEALMT